MPRVRPGLAVEKVMEVDLVLVASWPDPTLEVGDRYVFVDWGPEFVSAHAAFFPELTNPGMTFALGAMVAEYVINRQAAAYLPARYVKKYLDSGQLHLVPDAPAFPYPVWAVWREDLDPAILSAAIDVTAKIGQNAETDGEAVLDQLRAISENPGAVPERRD
jgi:DNA-binding transcriptional LysR family regulator